MNTKISISDQGGTVSISEDDTSVNPAVQELLDYFADPEDGYCTQQFVAEKLGVSQTTVHAWLRNKRPVQLHHAVNAQVITNGHVRAERLCPALAALIDTP